MNRYKLNKYKLKSGRKRARTSSFASTVKATKESGDMAISGTSTSRAIMARKFNCKLKYGEPHTALSTLTNPYGVYRLNSLADPNWRAGGHQPRGFDQLSTMYMRYYVRKATIRFTFFPQTDYQVRDGGTCYLYIQNDVATVPNEQHLLETGDVVKVAFGGKLRTDDTGYYSGNPIVVQKTVDITAFSSIKADADQNMALTTNSPTNQIYAFFIVKDNVGTAVEVGNYNVEITYHATFVEPRDPTTGS